MILDLKSFPTAGPIALASKHLVSDDKLEPFFVLNSDVISDYPFSKLIEFHKSHGKEGTICVSFAFNAAMHQQFLPQQFKKWNTISILRNSKINEHILNY